MGDADDEFYRDYDGRTRYERTLQDGRRIVVIVEDATRTVETVWLDRRNSGRQGRRWN